MVGTTVTVNILPFNQQLILTIIQVVIPLVGSCILLVFLYKYMPKMMNMIYNRNNMSYKDYNCKCGRCQYELRTKRGIRVWKRYHKYKRDELK